MKEQLQQVGLRIRELRIIAGYDLAEAAQKIGVSPDLYRRYEENGEDIPISVIYQLAGLYRVDTTEILSGKSPKLNTLSVVKKGEGILVERYAGYEYENVAFRFIHRTMEPMIVTLKPDSERPAMVTHSGQEINYCLEGKMLLLYNGAEIELAAGDCAYFDARRPHGQTAANREAAKFLTVINEAVMNESSMNKSEEGAL